MRAMGSEVAWSFELDRTWDLLGDDGMVVWIPRKHEFMAFLRFLFRNCCFFLVACLRTSCDIQKESNLLSSLKFGLSSAKTPPPLLNWTVCQNELGRQVN